MNVGFCHMLFSCVCGDDCVILFFVTITMPQMSSQAVIPGIKLTQSQCLNIQNCCQIQSDDVFDEDFCICGFEGFLLFCGFPPFSPLYWNVSLALVAESYFSKEFVKIGVISSLNISQNSSMQTFGPQKIFVGQIYYEKEEEIERHLYNHRRARELPLWENL